MQLENTWCLKTKCMTKGFIMIYIDGQANICTTALIQIDTSVLNIARGSSISNDKVTARPHHLSDSINTDEKVLI